MPIEKLLRVVLQNIARSKKNFIFSSIGIIVGITTFTFFLALSQGIQERVLNRIFPIDQLEVEPIGGVAAGASESTKGGDTLQSALSGGPRRLDAAAVEQLQAIPGVTKAFPKMRARFAAKIETGVLDRRMAGEGFFEGLDVSPAVVDEMRRFEDRCSLDEEDVCKRREVTCKTDSDCPHEGMSCLEGQCRPRQYWRSFEDRESGATCKAASECGPGKVCAYDKWIILKVKDKATIPVVKQAAERC